MGRMKRFCNYRCPDTECGRLRIFMWSLVQRVQEDHAKKVCRISITKRNIYVKKHVAYLTGKKTVFTTRRATANYQALLKFFEEEVFGKFKELSYSMNHFLNLLRGYDQLSYKYLIARHYGILPTHLRIQAISNIVAYPHTLSHEIRKKFFKVIDKLTPNTNWENKLEASDQVLLHHLKNGGTTYVTNWPMLSTFYLLKFFRNCSQHIGQQSDGFTDMNQWELDQVLIQRFPSVLTDLFNALHDEGLLKYLSLNPWDKWIIPTFRTEQEAENAEAENAEAENAEADAQ